MSKLRTELRAIVYDSLLTHVAARLGRHIDVRLFDEHFVLLSELVAVEDNRLDDGCRDNRSWCSMSPYNRSRRATISIVFPTSTFLLYTNCPFHRLSDRFLNISAVYGLMVCYRRPSHKIRSDSEGLVHMVVGLGRSIASLA